MTLIPDIAAWAAETTGVAEHNHLPLGGAQPLSLLSISVHRGASLRLGRCEAIDLTAVLSSALSYVLQE